MVAAGATTEEALQAFDANMGAGAVASGLAVVDTGKAAAVMGQPSRTRARSARIRRA